MYIRSAARHLGWVFLLAALAACGGGGGGGDAPASVALNPTVSPVNAGIPPAAGIAPTAISPVDPGVTPAVGIAPIAVSPASPASPVSAGSPVAVGKAPTPVSPVSAGTPVAAGSAPIAVSPASPVSAGSPVAVGKAPTPVSPVNVGTPVLAGAAQASIGQFTAAERDAALAEGLKIWRNQRIDINGINKGACANCHSADGIELALWRFLDDDITRRAHIDGVSPAEQVKLVKYFSALRQKYSVNTLRSVSDDRPFQPKGKPFDGATFSERDLQFASKSLGLAFPTLMNSVIDTPAKAQKAKAEIVANKPLDTQIGIPLPRISEDCARGGEHCSLNDWMADVPRIPIPGREKEWFELNDAYIANPTDARFRDLLLAVDTMTVPWRNADEVTGGAVGELGSQKFKSTQVLQHFIRRQQLGLFSASDDLNPLAPVRGLNLKRPNFPFIVGDVANDKAGTLLKTPSQLPIFARTSLGETPGQPLTAQKIAADKGDMKTPWWWVGFMLDTKLGSGTGQEYFLADVGGSEVGGYPFHALYARVHHGVSVPYRNNLTGADDPSLPALSRTAWNRLADFDRAYLFETPQARLDYRRAVANWLRMYMFLMREQMQTKGLSTFFPDDIQVNICSPGSASALRTWVMDAVGFDATNAALTLGLYNQIRVLASCAQAPLAGGYQGGTGTGLKSERFAQADEFSGGGLANKLGERVEPIIDMWREERPIGYFYRYTASIGAPVATNGPVQAKGSTRATGSVMAPVTGDFIIAEGSNGFGRIWLDGRLVYDEVRINEDNPKNKYGRFRAMPGVTVPMVAGRRYNLTYERYGNPTAGLSLGWATADGSLPMHVIPAEQLYPVPAF